MAKDSFIIATELLRDKEMEKLSNEKLGELFRSILAYAKTQEHEELDDMFLETKFDDFKDFFDENEKKYQEKVERINKINSNRNDIDTKSSQSRDDIVSDNVNDYVNDIDKEKEDTIVSSKEKSASRFIPPTVAEVRAYCQERRNNVDPETFVDFYTGKGWMVGKNKMKDWKAAVRTWEKNRGGPGPGSYKPRSKLDDLRSLYKEIENEGDDYEKERNGYMLGLPF